MTTIDNKVNDINIAYIGGGSKGWAWRLMSDLALDEQISGTVRLYDIDFDAANNNEIIGTKLSSMKEAKGKWKYKAVKTLKEALENTDFVIISILPGTFNEMSSDVHAPEEYGIYQSVGDTVGPGGLIRALRTIPMFMEIAEAIKKFSPDAWVINYTNPMTLCTRTLYEVFPQVKAFGCCHEVFNTQKLLTAMLEDMKGIKGVTRQEIKTNVLGINHFTWFDKAYYKDIDLIPLYREFVDKYYYEGFSEGKKDEWMNDNFSSANRVKFDLFRRYGLIAAAGDRHLAEFVPGWYLESPERVKEYKFGLTPVKWRIEHKNELDEKAEKLINGEEKLEITPSGEEGIGQIKALLGLNDIITNVNIPNVGQLPGIPLGAVVETNAVFRSNELRPVMAGRLPDNINGLVVRHVYNQETVLRAALKKDKEQAFSAFSNDPLMRIGLDDARKLFDKMFNNTKEYLNGWN